MVDVMKILATALEKGIKIPKSLEQKNNIFVIFKITCVIKNKTLQKKRIVGIL